MNYNDRKDCISTCWECRSVCQETLYNHCLEEGGAHTEPAHIRIMNDCIQICQAAADSMLRNSPVHSVICVACAEICDACARSCDDVGGDIMGACAMSCRRCAAHCRDMGRKKFAA